MRAAPVVDFLQPLTPEAPRRASSRGGDACDGHPGGGSGGSEASSGTGGGSQQQ